MTKSHKHMTPAASVTPHAVHPVWHLFEARQASITRRLRARDMIGLSGAACFVVGFVAFLAAHLLYPLSGSNSLHLLLLLMWPIVVLEVVMRVFNCLWRRPSGEP